MRAPALLAVAAALALAAPASAQTTETPVVGGGSFNAAPILEPGSYSDTVLPAEYIFYAIRVQPGQRLHLSGHTDLSQTDLLHLGIPQIYLTIQSPTRMNAVPGDGSYQEGIAGSEGGDFVGPTVQATDDTATGGPWAGPGVYFLSVQAVWRGSTAEPPKVEIPFHFTVSLEGTAEPRATPTATPTPTRTATPAPTAAAQAGDGGNGGAVAAGVGIGGVLIGLIGGIALRRRRR